MTWMIKDVLVIETAVATFVAPVTRTAEDISVDLEDVDGGKLGN